MFNLYMETSDPTDCFKCFDTNQLLPSMHGLPCFGIVGTVDCTALCGSVGRRSRRRRLPKPARPTAGVSSSPKSSELEELEVVVAMKAE